MACNVLTNEAAFILITSGEFVAERFLLKAESGRLESDNTCDKVADSSGHGLRATGNRNAHPLYNTCLICGREYLEKWWCSIRVTNVYGFFLLDFEIKNPTCRPTHCRLIL
jgi:hypothetical protein